MKPRPVPPGFQRVRRDRQIQEAVHDSYKAREKPAEPTVCPDCGAVFHEGRWQRRSVLEPAHHERCPACHRVHDRFPAGYLMLEGDFVRERREELLHLLRHVESRETAEHPLQRIMDIQPGDDGLTVTTTDPRLARALGDAVQHAYRGSLEYHYNRDQNLLRVHWAK